MGNKRNSILEGLSELHRVDEGTSVFNDKLKTVMKDISKENQDFIKNALNKMYLGIMKDYDGYTEGKRPVVKNMNTYTFMTWKLQTKKKTGYDGLTKYIESTGNQSFSYNLGGDSYTCISDKFKKNGKEDVDYLSYREFNKAFSIESDILVGYTIMWMKNEKVLPNEEGTTFKFIVSVPNANAVKIDNPYVEKDDTNYYFRGKDYVASYRQREQAWSITTGSGYNEQRTLYKKSPKADKALDVLYASFTDKMTRGEFENTLEKCGVKYSTIYMTWD